jgi:hypothetical protein
MSARSCRIDDLLETRHLIVELNEDSCACGMIRQSKSGILIAILLIGAGACRFFCAARFRR